MVYPPGGWLLYSDTFISTTASCPPQLLVAMPLAMLLPLVVPKNSTVYPLPLAKQHKVSQMLLGGQYTSPICNGGSGSLSGMRLVDRCHGCAFLLFFWLVEPTITPIKNCSHQHTNKEVNNALMQAFLLEHPIGGGRLSTMGWMVPNFGKGGSIGDSGFGVSFVQLCVWYTIFFCLTRLMILPEIFESGKKMIWTPNFSLHLQNSINRTNSHHQHTQDNFENNLFNDPAQKL
jgi:hypothetical protein